LASRSQFLVIQQQALLMEGSSTHCTNQTNSCMQNRETKKTLYLKSSIDHWCLQSKWKPLAKIHRYQVHLKPTFPQLLYSSCIFHTDTRETSMWSCSSYVKQHMAGIEEDSSSSPEQQEESQCSLAVMQSTCGD
jgi:hypothetical protein